METSLLTLSFVPLLSACLLIAYYSVPVLSIPPLLGIHPLDGKYFASEVIKCKDGSKSVARDRINDNFCDCTDGTDEPGTSACPTGKFYCRNVGSIPLFLFSSRVNDRICDCCDGSDEYDGSVNCPNRCVMGGNVVYTRETSSSTISDLGSIDTEETKKRISLEELIQKLKGMFLFMTVLVQLRIFIMILLCLEVIPGLKIVIILQLFLIGCLVAFWLFRRRVRSRRRRYR
ncbi:hypothetical protein L1049_023596 [Liquidambar formosana]|uniref:Glucosidase II beta subunit N-terminal domain-containing protein n=1 Tax=Liquidambar formosana TaxID=63359 RepID=A0AAP0WXT4_LIQFO